MTLADTVPLEWRKNLTVYTYTPGKGKGRTKIWEAKEKERQGSIFWTQNYIYSPPPSKNDIFFPSRGTPFFDCHHDLFALIFPLLLLFYPFTSPFLIFFPLSLFFFPLSFHFLPFSFLFLSFFFPLSSFFFPLSPFFFYIFPLFIFSFSYFSPQITTADIPPQKKRKNERKLKKLQVKCTITYTAKFHAVLKEKQYLIVFKNRNFLIF